jgi:hypothetical protein
VSAVFFQVSIRARTAGDKFGFLKLPERLFDASLNPFIEFLISVT